MLILKQHKSLLLSDSNYLGKANAFITHQRTDIILRQYVFDIVYLFGLVVSSQVYIYIIIQLAISVANCIDIYPHTGMLGLEFFLIHNMVALRSSG